MIQTTYDALQHCVAVKTPQDKSVAMDCPYTGKGEEFSPTNLVEAALGGCMLISMGTFAMRREIDLSGARIDVAIEATDAPRMRFKSVDVAVTMPAGVEPNHQEALKRAADACPIKHSFSEDIPVEVCFHWLEV